MIVDFDFDAAWNRLREVLPEDRCGLERGPEQIVIRPRVLAYERDHFIAAPGSIRIGWYSRPNETWDDHRFEKIDHYRTTYQDGTVGNSPTTLYLGINVSKLSVEHETVRLALLAVWDEIDRQWQEVQG